MNSVFTFIFLIVVVAIGADLIKSYLKSRDDKNSRNEELRETLTKVNQLEDRIRVLERIVTEKRFDLRKEIDSL